VHRRSVQCEFNFNLGLGGCCVGGGGLLKKRKDGDVYFCKEVLNFVKKSKHYKFGCIALYFFEDLS